MSRSGTKAAWIAGLCICASALAETKRATVENPPGVSDVLTMIAQYPPDPGARSRLLKALDETPSTGDGDLDLARGFHTRAKAARELGMRQREIAELERALFHAKRGQIDDSNQDGGLPRVLSDLANAELQDGSPIRAIELWQTHLNLNPIVGYQIGARTNMARAHLALGDIEAAQRAIREAEEILSSTRRSPFFPGFLSYVASASGHLTLHKGKPEEAERHFRSALSHQAEDLAQMNARLATGHSSRTAATILTFMNITRGDLATALTDMGRLDEAEFYAREALRDSLSRQGRGSIDSARSTSVLAMVLSAAGRFAESAELGRLAVEMFEEAGADRRSINYAGGLRRLGAVLSSTGSFPDSVRTSESLLNDLNTTPALAGTLANGTPPWGLALAMTNRASEGVAMLTEVLARQIASHGDGSQNTEITRGFLAIALFRNGQRSLAHEAFLKALGNIYRLDPARLSQLSQNAASALSVRRILEGYLELLTDGVNGLPIPANDERIAILDLVVNTTVQKAVSAAAVRTTPGDPAVAALVRRDQDLEHETNALHSFVSDQLSAPPARQVPKVAAEMRRRIAEIENERRTLGERLRREFPSYAALVHPPVPTLDRIRGALSAREGIVTIFVGERASYVWSIIANGPALIVRAPVSEKEIRAYVSRVRRTIDPSSHGLGIAIPPFDLDGAFQLYRHLLGPFEAAWKDLGTLNVVTTGPLALIPLSMLPTRPTESLQPSTTMFSEYRNVPWLARRLAIVQVPSIGAFLTLRASTANSKGRRFAGFGDPIFSRNAESPPGTSVLATQASSFRLRGVAATASHARSALSKLARLPDTAEEILGIAQTLGADPTNDLFLRERATESAVKSGALSDRQVIAFATHGLVPGDISGLTQPALALSAPTSNDDGDGLLTMEEILALKLNADWVVLSACNTAAGDGRGADAVSGLGRAFFYAGARALLVSNWPVETVSAKQLTVSLFGHQMKSPTIGRAEALRQAMLELIDRGEMVSSESGRRYSYAHPLFWAPFSLVGDGR